MSTSVICTDLSFAWPDGEVVLDRLTAVFGPGRTGLVGLNGSGKSTLLRLITGDLTPTSGSVTVTGRLGHLSQNLTLDTDSTVADVLGTADITSAIAAIERGDTDEHHFAVVGDRWDIAERTRATLDRLGLAHLDTGRHIGDLSAGEAVLLGLGAQFLHQPDVLLLDEPTNNLDARARTLVTEFVRTWKGAIVVVSHDREILGEVDRIAELRDRSLTFYGGDLDHHEAVVAAQQQAAERMVRAAESDVERQRRELVTGQVTLARRVRYGRKQWDTKREPKVRMRKRQEDAEIAAGKHRAMRSDKLAQARQRLEQAEHAVRSDKEIRVDLPTAAVPAGRHVLRLTDVELRNGPMVNLNVHGPERIALVGPNGAGKSTLLHTVVGDLTPRAGTVTAPVPARLLPQRLDTLDDTASAVQNVAAAAPGLTANAIRARLARFLLRGDLADLPAGELSGGERFRASLAQLLLAEPAPQLLLLDEPTTDLDASSVRHLTRELASYPGALIVTSHDTEFLRAIGATRWLRLDGTLNRTEAP
ncbi:ATPase subunit of ABC transporter with duplicated ATPase domains [Prauserella sediminis]|uniref:ATPase subunit of ABC transporter with duplicated ATPase domains n=1 Tax=Prauserella sediminis TaxID=577680 RepID=A0A839XWL8_9PSEU|nr:ABC-F family ATP-binding cassette domain-containing protein [Prauserella sediminis]MBB3665458.1 ATPase subunit of ABC transporter with duplicated ATPase domains [Prauserella sediminis]